MSAAGALRRNRTPAIGRACVYTSPMAVRSAQVTVDAVRDILADGSADDTRSDFSVVLTNRGTVPVFVGGSDVTTSNGFELEPGGVVSALLVGGESLYGVTAASSARVDVLRSGVV